MEAILKSGKKIHGKIAQILVKKGRAIPIELEPAIVETEPVQEEVIDPITETVQEEPVVETTEAKEEPIVEEVIEPTPEPVQEEEKPVKKVKRQKTSRKSKAKK